MELKIEYVPLASIKPYRGNAKLHPADQVKQIDRSIEEFGFDGSSAQYVCGMSVPPNMMANIATEIWNRWLKPAE